MKAQVINSFGDPSVFTDADKSKPRASRKNPRKIVQIVDEGKLKPLIDQHHFNLEEISEVHKLLESGKAKGKVVKSI